LMSANIRHLAATLSVLFLLVSLGVGYWQIVQGDELSSDPYNPRLYSEAAKRERGRIVDRDGVVLARTDASSDSFKRVYTGALYNDQGKPLLDRAVMGLYPPGSTFKLVTGAAAVELGLDPNKKVRIDSPWKGDPSWGNYAVPSPINFHGEYDLRQAYAYSENI